MRTRFLCVALRASVLASEVVSGAHGEGCVASASFLGVPKALTLRALSVSRDGVPLFDFHTLSGDVKAASNSALRFSFCLKCNHNSPGVFGLQKYNNLALL